MQREEFRSYLKAKFKQLGYQRRKSCFYKIIDEDYLIGFDLDPCSFAKGYSITCGFVFLPDHIKIPFCGKYDMSWYFRFPDQPGAAVDFEKRNWLFEYEKYSVEQLDAIFDANYEYFVVPMFDKNYGLSIFRESWEDMNTLHKKKIELICEKCGLDADEVISYLGLRFDE